jgi:hypothetical protein
MKHLVAHAGLEGQHVCIETSFERVGRKGAQAYADKAEQRADGEEESVHPFYCATTRLVSF